MGKKLLYIFISLAILPIILFLLYLAVDDGIALIFSWFIATAAVLLALLITQVVLIIFYSMGRKKPFAFGYAFTWVYAVVSLALYAGAVFYLFKMQEMMKSFYQETMAENALSPEANADAQFMQNPFTGSHCLLLLPVLAQALLVYFRLKNPQPTQQTQDPAQPTTV